MDGEIHLSMFQEILMLVLIKNMGILKFELSKIEK